MQWAIKVCYEFLIIYQRVEIYERENIKRIYKYFGAYQKGKKNNKIQNHKIKKRREKKIIHFKWIEKKLN